MRISVEPESLVTASGNLSSLAQQLGSDGGVAKGTAAALEGAVGDPVLSASVSRLAATLGNAFVNGATTGAVLSRLLGQAGGAYAQTDQWAMPAGPSGPAG